jgi:hypothetical protein
MALIGNRSVLHKSPGRFLSGTVASIERSGFSKAGMLANRFQAMSLILGGIPTGHLAPSSWALPRTAGALSAVNSADFSIAAGSLNLAEGRNIAGDTTITFSLPNADLQLVVSASGDATITFSQSALLAGALSADGSATITFNVGTATLGALIDAVASASFSLTGAATATALGELAGDITPFTELSPESLAASVGNLVIDGTYTLTDVLKILAAVAAGKSTVTDLGGGSAEVVFRDLSDTLDRVVADMTNSDRITVTIDPS